MARPVAYGQAFGGKSIVQIPAAASQSFRAEGGRWVTLDGSRLATIASNNLPDLIGWVETSGTFSTSSTAGQDILAVNVADDAVYEMPVVSALTESSCKILIGKQCDLETISDIQYCNYDASSVDNIMIVGYKFYNTGVGGQSVLVRKQPLNASLTGGA
jgi:hypothetical protein